MIYLEAKPSLTTREGLAFLATNLFDLRRQSTALPATERPSPTERQPLFCLLASAPLGFWLVFLDEVPKECLEAPEWLDS
jgi:hypothetical protein